MRDYLQGKRCMVWSFMGNSRMCQALRDYGDGLEGIYDYASKDMQVEKIFMGLPGYGWNWQIYDRPENFGKSYRGTSNTYYAAKLWMTGSYNFTDDAPPQFFIPILAYLEIVSEEAETVRLIYRMFMQTPYAIAKYLTDKSSQRPRGKRSGGTGRWRTSFPTRNTRATHACRSATRWTSFPRNVSRTKGKWHSIIWRAAMTPLSSLRSGSL